MWNRNLPNPRMRTEEPRTWSLRNRLLLLMVLVTSGIWGMGTLWIYSEARQAGQRLFDEALRETGSLLLQLAQHEIEEHGLSLGVLLLSAEARPGPYEFRYQIWTDNLRSAYRSANAPESPLLALSAEGFGWTMINGERWRAYATWNRQHSLQIQIAQSLRYRQDLSQSVVLVLALAAALLLPLAAALIWWILARSFRPLQQSAASVAARGADDMRTVAEDGAPIEVLPLLQALNRLLDRLRIAFQLERRFTADAAHELRTPLAAIRANAQVMKGARSAEEVADVGNDLVASVDRGSRVIEQLLSMARADAAAGELAGAGPVLLSDLIANQCRDQGPMAAQRNVQLHSSVADCRVHGRADLLLILLRNLLDNAIRHAPEGSQVEVACRVESGHALLAVSDEGPGIPAAERERVFERFYRLPGETEHGSGLGLSIVRRIAELHGGEIRILEREGTTGTTVLVSLPLVTAHAERGA
jgi:two-component system OmpR family sensor kinase/two-component system sensor histidine kinase QseC